MAKIEALFSAIIQKLMTFFNAILQIVLDLIKGLTKFASPGGIILLILIALTGIWIFSLIGSSTYAWVQHASNGLNHFNKKTASIMGNNLRYVCVNMMFDADNLNNQLTSGISYLGAQSYVSKPFLSFISIPALSLFKLDNIKCSGHFLNVPGSVFQNIGSVWRIGGKKKFTMCINHVPVGKQVFQVSCVSDSFPSGVYHNKTLIQDFNINVD